MHGMNREMLLQLKRPVRTGILACVVPLLLAGCAGVGGDVTPEPPEKESVSASPSTQVAQLPAGRTGFVIRESARLDPTARADFDRAAGLLREEEYAQAISLLEGVVAQSPGVSAPYINLAIAYQHEGKAELAEKQLKVALVLVPGHPVASNEYGLLCRKAGRFDEARTIYEQSLAAFPDYPPIRRNLGILWELYLNDPAAALTQYELYSQAVPEDEQVKLWVAELRGRLGR